MAKNNMMNAKEANYTTKQNIEKSKKAEVAFILDQLFDRISDATRKGFYDLGLGERFYIRYPEYTIKIVCKKLKELGYYVECIDENTFRVGW